MKRPLIVFSVLVILGSPLLVSAQDTYGFSWGVSVGDQIPYNIEITTDRSDNVSQTYTEDVIVTVEYVENLSEIQFYEIFPPTAQTSFMYANGTEIGNRDPIFGYINSILIFPIGNWTHYKYIVENIEAPANVSMVYAFSEDLFTWSLHIDLSYASNNFQNVTYQFSKSDGALNSFVSYYYVELTVRDVNVISWTTTAEISRTDSGWFIPTFIISAIAIIAEVIIVIEIIRRYRGRNVVVAG